MPAFLLATISALLPSPAQYVQTAAPKLCILAHKSSCFSVNSTSESGMRSVERAVFITAIDKAAVAALPDSNFLPCEQNYSGEVPQMMHA